MCQILEDSDAEDEVVSSSEEEYDQLVKSLQSVLDHSG